MSGKYDSYPRGAVQTSSTLDPRRTHSETSLRHSSSLKRSVHRALYSPTLEPGLGQPRSKKYIQTTEAEAVALSVVCFAFAVATVTPSLRWAWELQYTGQIIVIGFLLSVQAICFRHIYPTIFLQAEARWGKSQLQNYDSILRNSVMAAHTSLIWRILVFLFIALPLALSVGYKRFTGGTSTINIPTRAMRFGRMSPPGSLHSSAGTTLMANLTAPFIVATEKFFSQPVTIEQALGPYGFNMLLLSNGSTAFLDVPFPDQVIEIQNQLTELEIWYLKADVNATVSHYNNTAIDGQRSSYKNPVWKFLNVTTNLYEGSMYTGYSVYSLLDNLVLGDASYAAISLAKSSTGVLINPSNNSATWSRFIENALLFRIFRQYCTGTWAITKTSIELVGGSCNGSRVDYQGILTVEELGLQIYFLPLLQEYLGAFTPPGPYNGSPWFIPVASTAMSGLTHARITALNSAKDYYIVRPRITSTRQTLRSEWGLYFILIVFPALTIGFIVAETCFHDVPIDGGFGLISILAGIEPSSLGFIKGAGLSGKLSRGVRLQITAEQSSSELRRKEAHIEYRINSAANNGWLRRQLVVY